MKKYLALLAAVMMLVCAGTAFSADSGSTAGHGGNIPIVDPGTEVIVPPAVDEGTALDETPTTPGGEAEAPAPEDSGSEEAKTSEVAVSAGDTQESKEVVEDVTTDVDVPQLSDADKENLTQVTTPEEANKSVEEKQEELGLKSELTEDKADELNAILTDTSLNPDGTEKTNADKGTDAAAAAKESGLIAPEAEDQFACFVEGALNNGETDIAAIAQDYNKTVNQLADNENAGIANLDIPADVSQNPDDVELADADEDDTDDFNKFAKLTAEQETLNGNTEGASDMPFDDVARGPFG